MATPPTSRIELDSTRLSMDWIGDTMKETSFVRREVSCPLELPSKKAVIRSVIAC